MSEFFVSLYISDALFDVMLCENHFYDYFRCELKKISRRLNMGLEDMMDITVATGILNTFLESTKPEIIEEARSFITKYPVLKKYLSIQFNF